MESIAMEESTPEFVAQLIFVLLLAGLMFFLGFLFRPMNAKRRVKRAERKAELASSWAVAK